jgi:hypothetical protein
MDRLSKALPLQHQRLHKIYPLFKIPIKLSAAIPLNEAGKEWVCIWCIFAPITSSSLRKTDNEYKHSIKVNQGKKDKKIWIPDRGRE